MLASNVSSSIRRRAIGVVAASGIGLLATAPRASDQGVAWTDLVNVAVSGDVLQKTSGCDGCEDAGAASQQSFAQGDGFVEFTVGETNTFWVAGLSHGDDNTTI